MLAHSDGSAREGAPLKDSFGQVGNTDLATLGQDHGTLDGVAQFAEVTGPPVMNQGFPSLEGEPDEPAPGLAGEEGQEVIGQNGQ